MGAEDATLLVGDLRVPLSAVPLLAARAMREAADLIDAQQARITALEGFLLPLVSVNPVFWNDHYGTYACGYCGTTWDTWDGEEGSDLLGDDPRPEPRPIEDHEPTCAYRLAVEGMRAAAAKPHEANDGR